MLREWTDCQTSLAEFAEEAANKVQIVFGRGVYVDENTSQAASVELVCQWQTNYARSRLQNLAEKAEGLFRQDQNSRSGCFGSRKLGLYSSCPLGNQQAGNDPHQLIQQHMGGG